MKQSKDSKIYGKSQVGEGTTIEDFVIIGCPTRTELKSQVIEGALLGKNCVVRAHSIIYSGVKIGEDFFCGHNVLIREKTIIGNNVLVGSGTIIDGFTTIGNRISIQSSVYIPTNCTIEDDVFIGPRVVLTNDKYMVKGAELKGPVIRKGARIGANSVILPGVEIGENAVVGAGSVVTKNVNAGSVVAGNPAREISLTGAGTSIESTGVTKR
jgi:acetyltransferase-like isoleucine patch superfamily enzyme